MRHYEPKMNEVLRAIIDREDRFAKDVAEAAHISETSFRRMLNAKVKMDADSFAKALDAMGYKIVIVKKEDML